MKRVIITLGALALFATAIVAQAETGSIEQFDVSQDPACWVAPEWRD